MNRRTLKKKQTNKQTNKNKKQKTVKLQFVQRQLLFLSFRWLIIIIYSVSWVILGQGDLKPRRTCFFDTVQEQESNYGTIDSNASMKDKVLDLVYWNSPHEERITVASPS